MLDYVFSTAFSRLQMISWAYSASLDDPVGSSVILHAVKWLVGTVLGTMAATVAVIAVATVGLLALGGRIDVRRALTVVLGCFVLFGSSGLVAGLQNLIREDGIPLRAPVAQADISPLATLQQRPAGYDPYAGASVPTRYVFRLSEASDDARINCHRMWDSCFVDSDRRAVAVPSAPAPFSLPLRTLSCARLRHPSFASRTNVPFPLPRT